ncbi:MAG: hypothetical protein IJI24_02515 [Lachnospiraceae bacterium]|nr:hypothetical protein [Lachnospiraceae bacterium]
MKKNGSGMPASDGVITVFFALLTPLFLALLFIMVESVRFQGARAQTVQITDMAAFSAFGEFERELLEQYGIFAVDGSYGSGDFSVGRMNDRIMHYLELNAYPDSSGLKALCFDPWQVIPQVSQIKSYGLLSDRNAGPFYQQAVAYMRKTAVTASVGKLLEYYQDAQHADSQKEAYQKKNTDTGKELDNVDRAMQEAREEAAENDMEGQQNASSVSNPIGALKRLRRKKLMKIVCPQGGISKNKVSSGELCSKRWGGRSGNWDWNFPYGGLTDNLLFREYLLSHFPHYGSEDEGKALHYQIEYIIAGKTSDEANLKKTVKELLALREACNYLCCVKSSHMSSQAELLATLLIGWTGIYELVAALKHVLLLGWSYAESLMDVRTLLEGGRVPLVKTEENWVIGLEELSSVNELIAKGGRGSSEGYLYEDFLRILLNLQSVSLQQKRGLDMLEMNMRSLGFSRFRADACIVCMKNEVKWTIRPLFGRVSGAFLGLSSGQEAMLTKGGFSYVE